MRILKIKEKKRSIW